MDNTRPKCDNPLHPKPPTMRYVGPAKILGVRYAVWICPKCGRTTHIVLTPKDRKGE